MPRRADDEQDSGGRTLPPRPADEQGSAGRTPPPRPADEQGFTLIELIVVILIIGVLAEIAIPSFLGQAAKAHDAAAKSAVDTARTAIESYRVDHGNYCGADPAALVAIEPALAGSPSLTVDACPGGNPRAYAVTVASTSPVATVYTVSVDDATVTRTCSPTGTGGCAANGAW